MKPFKNQLFVVAGFVVLLFSVGVAVYFYTQYLKADNQLKSQEKISKDQKKEIISEVSKLMVLPEEEPTLAIVKDKTKLKDQPFFQNAENEDVALIFTKAQKAILYRPALKKIIEVAPLTIGAQSTATPEAPLLPTQSGFEGQASLKNKSAVKAAIYNASKTAGLAASTEARLKVKFSEIVVVKKTNSQGEYNKNLVIDLTGKQKILASTLAKFLAGEVGPFPSAEIKPDADILIIVVD